MTTHRPQTCLEWFYTLRMPLREKEELGLQHIEAKAAFKGDKKSNMLNCLEETQKSNKSFSGLTVAENISLIMYTRDNSENAFYGQFNNECRNSNWYAEYTPLCYVLQC